MPKVVDISSKRSEFIAASLDVIASEGLGAASLRRIAAQAGCTTGSITHYFSGREALLLEAVATAHYAAGARMQRVAQAAPTAAARLEAVTLEALPLDTVRMREWKVWVAFWSEVPSNSQLARENGRGYARWRGLLETLLAPLCGDAEDTRREAALLVALVDGIGVRLALLTDGGEALAREQQRAASDLCAYLKSLAEHRR